MAKIYIDWRDCAKCQEKNSTLRALPLPLAHERNENSGIESPINQNCLIQFMRLISLIRKETDLLPKGQRDSVPYHLRDTSKFTVICNVGIFSARVRL